MMRARSIPLALLSAALPFAVACSSTPADNASSSGANSSTSGGGGGGATSTSASSSSSGSTNADAGPNNSCADNSACASGVCTDGVCAEASCTDGVKNGAEVGVDCGGTCPKKCDGQACTAKTECTSNICFESKCAPVGTKTCGVGLPTQCVAGEPCQQPLDCATDYCSAAVCAAAPSTANKDGERNAFETDVDCGGPSGILCEAGKKCKTSADCTSTCNAQGTCDVPSDTDGKKNNGETDVDCGGPNAKKCATGKACATGPDCGLGYCPANVCVTPTAGDGVKNGTETDVDCGGASQTFAGVTVPAGPGCALTKKCALDTDCGSAVCAATKICIEAPSCRPLHGGQTCGTGEFGQLGAAHESCCRTLPVAGQTIVQGGVAKQVYLDKYEITSGRVREWVAAIKAQYNGVPNVQAWVTARIAVDPILAAMYKNVSGAPADATAYLPNAASGQFANFPLAAGGQTPIDLGLESQIGPTSYYRGVQTGGTSGCYLGAGAYGHRTYYYDQALAQNFSEVPRAAEYQAQLDEKSMNCMTPLMFAAFCAWDGGYLPTQSVIAAAYGPNQWPWGDTPAPNDEVAKIANYNAGTSGFGANKTPRYLFPQVDYATFANDETPIIAAPGRFPGDIASKARPNQESWMDMGGNMIEWNFTGSSYYGWFGSSFEGHFYPRLWNSGLYYLDKYGKGGARCMRLK